MLFKRQFQQLLLRKIPGLFQMSVEKTRCNYQIVATRTCFVWGWERTEQFFSPPCEYQKKGQTNIISQGSTCKNGIVAFISLNLKPQKVKPSIHLGQIWGCFGYQNDRPWFLCFSIPKHLNTRCEWGLPWKVILSKSWCHQRFPKRNTVSTIWLLVRINFNKY